MPGYDPQRGRSRPRIDADAPAPIDDLLGEQPEASEPGSTPAATAEPVADVPAADAAAAAEAVAEEGAAGGSEHGTAPVPERQAPAGRTPEGAAVGLPTGAPHRSRAPQVAALVVFALALLAAVLMARRRRRRGGAPD